MIRTSKAYPAQQCKKIRRPSRMERQKCDLRDDFNRASARRATFPHRLCPRKKPRSRVASLRLTERRPLGRRGAALPQGDIEHRCCRGPPNRPRRYGSAPSRRCLGPTGSSPRYRRYALGGERWQMPVPPIGGLSPGHPAADIARRDCSALPDRPDDRRSGANIG